jgi:hypothetical protein
VAPILESRGHPWPPPELSAKLFFIRIHYKSFAAEHFYYGGPGEQMNSRGRTFLLEHSKNVLRGAVAEELPQGLFVIRMLCFSTSAMKSAGV